MVFSSILVLLLVLTNSVGTVDAKIASNAGTTSATFLKIGIGARPTALAGTYCGIADDVLSLYWNPAGLTNIKKKEVFAQHIVWLADIGYEYLAYAHPIEKIGTFGIGVGYLSTGSIEKRKRSPDYGVTGQGPGTYVTEGEKVGSYKGSDMAINIAYARQLREDISLGLNLKYVQETIDGTSANTASADIGAKYILKLKGRDINLGLAVQNIFGSMKFVNESFSLPLNIKLGAGYKLLDDKLTVGLDLNVPKDDVFHISAGGEYKVSFKDFIFPLRLGYNTNADLGFISGLSTGFGVNWKTFSLDFAFSPYGDLGNIYRISFGAKF